MHIKQILLILFTSSVLSTFVILIVIASGAFSVKRSNEQVFNQCEDFEKEGVIPENSCNCTKHLFKNFSDSYDWTDSCKIVQSSSSLNIAFN